LYAHARALAGTIPVVYLPDYDLALAQTLTAGVDVWLNTPLPPLEASGTSGMKAAFNACPICRCSMAGGLKAASKA